MFKSLLKSYQIMFTQKVNMWIYYIKKIPFIGKLFSDDAYAATDFKVVAPTIVAILSLLLGFLLKYAYVFFVLVFPAFLITEFQTIILENPSAVPNEILKYHLLFFLNFVAGPFTQNKFTDEVHKDFIIVKLMRFEAKSYYLSKILLLGIKSFLYFILPLKLLDISLLECLIISLEIACIRFIIQSFHMITGKADKAQLSTKWYYGFPLVIVPFLCAFFLPMFGICFDSRTLILSVPFMATIYALGTASLIYLFKSTKYNLLAKSMVTQSNTNQMLNGVISETDVTFGNVKFEEKHINASNLKDDKYKDKFGMEYLNLKFVQRHKKIVIVPILRITALIFLAFCAYLLLLFFTPELKKDTLEMISSATGALVFLFYFLSNGERFTRALFFNCDNSLLRHSFYREPKVILSNFTYRLKLTVLLNLIPALTIGISFLIIIIICSGELINFLPIFISILTLPVFFAVHYLFLYYIVQPYTSQLTVKSPIYKAAGFIVYGASYACMNIHTSSIIFTGVIVTATMIYTIAAIISVYKYAPKTFKLK